MISSHELEGFVAAARAKRILVIGDLLLDHYVRGHASRISPEAPVPIVRVEGEEERLGGAGNVVRNLLALGCQVRLCAVAGADAAGDALELMLRSLGVGGFLLREAGRTTSTKTRILAGNQQILRIDRETAEPLRPETERVFLERLAECLDWADGIFLPDYRKGTLTDRVLQALLPAREKPVYVDARGRDVSRYRGATLVKPNQREAEEASGVEIVDGESLDRAGRALLEDSSASFVLITRGAQGMSLFTRGAPRRDIPVHTLDVFDVTGAGDTVLSFAGLGHLCGMPMESAARLATLAAGIVIQKVGAVAAELHELEAAVGKPAGVGKLLERAEAAARCRLARRQGKTVVFTNGCFDLLHVGHLHLLRQARAFGDLLVVGLNTDASIRGLKGPSRPLLPELERAAMLAALDGVDAVVLFDEPTPFELIRELRPDVLVKGDDYARDQVVGADLVEGWGGRVELVHLEPGKSTTRLIQRILERHSKGPA